MSTPKYADIFDTKEEYRRRKELEAEAMKYMTIEDIRKAQEAYTLSDFTFKSPKRGAFPPSLDYRRIASELGYRNQRFRGIGPDAVQEIVELIQEVIPTKDREYIHVGGYDYEDLFHQACQALELAYEGEDVEGDAAELLNLWNKILTQAGT